MKKPSFSVQLLSIVSGILIAFCGVSIQSEEKADSYYTTKVPSRDGIGKVYMGREISHTVSAHAIRWLERPEREGEENPSQVMDQLELKGDETIADIGAGSGYFTFLLAPYVPEGKVIAIDIQQEMLDFLEAKKKLHKAANVETLLGTIEDTKLPENSTDLVLMVDAYHEFSHPREMMESVVEGLKPGGRVVLLEYRAEDPSVPIKPLHKMTVKQVKAEMTAVGLEFVELKDFLPAQHFLVFQKPTNK
ncbi:MAG: class I SAM-dependent methyltransferase [Verrucomicrobiales bacterium]|nr:class I SAM-dependent methyltransferase [Verrucomicrobiales bacterium]